MLETILQWVCEQTFISTSAQLIMQCGTSWKILDRQIKTDTTKTKHNPEKAKNTKNSQTELAQLRCFLRHSARKLRGLILQHSWAHTGRPYYRCVTEHSEITQFSTCQYTVTYQLLFALSCSWTNSVATNLICEKSVTISNNSNTSNLIGRYCWYLYVEFV